MKSRQAANCFCAFCKTPRRIFVKKRVNFLNIGLSIMAGFAVGYAIFQEFDPRSLLFCVLSIVLAETFIQIRWRLSVVCSQCGFDPVLYIRNAPSAAEKVRVHLERRKNDPRFVLATPLNLPSIKAQPAPRPAPANGQKHTGRLLSKQV